MIQQPDQTSVLPQEGILGFLQYTLGETVKLDFVSRSLLELLGVSREKLQNEDGFLSCMLPENRRDYVSAVSRCRKAPCRESLVYEILAADGKIQKVRGTLTSWKNPDGSCSMESVLFSAGEQQTPWSCLFCTCEKHPRITYLNGPMKDLLRIPQSRDGEADYLELYRENVYLMVPMEERRRFAQYLERICTETVPVFGEMALLRCDGTRAHVFGWVTRGRDHLGNEEFQAMCLDVTEHYESRKEQTAHRYLNALKDVYDKIFQYDLGEGTIKCLYDAREMRFRLLQNIPMQLEETMEKWVSQTVVPEQQKQVLEFFREYCRKKGKGLDTGPSSITYRARSSSGEIRSYSGIFLKMDEKISLYCCRCVQEQKETEQLRTENDSLKENMQELMMQFTDGIAAFQVADGMVTPLYITDNICEFFGRTREEWLPMMKNPTPIREFVSQSAVDYEKFEDLLREGEAEFSYWDVKTGQEQRMKAICSHKMPAEKAPRYVMLYNVEKQPQQLPHVYIRTFGYFDVFVDENPIPFKNKKAGELLALLVDRKGGFVSSEEAISCLWEEEPVNALTLARYRKVALRLKNLLVEYGISEIMESVDGKRRVNPQKLSCDLYDYLSGREEYASLFKGSYLLNYSWGESTLAELSGISIC